ncbi:hypothetical protein [Kitasatospora nipponensis]|uniref:hypothetical protein n=1 Tax=Kitasatospora nipponensis TaxID=258049 RepID=UPI0031DFB213
MYLVRLELANPELPQPSRTDAERILDVLWAHLQPRFGIEHIRVRAGPAGINLGLFFRGSGTDAATHSSTAIAHLLARIPEWEPKIPP